MQIDSPGTAAAIARSGTNFRLAVRAAASFVVVLWLIQWLITALELGPQNFGVRPRQLIGLIGIVCAPLVHGDFAHLLSNSLPLIVAGATMLYLYPRSSLRVLPAVYFGPGLAVWLFAAGSSHVGASVMCTAHVIWPALAASDVGASRSPTTASVSSVTPTTHRRDPIMVLLREVERGRE